jgi:pyrroline-5-carboxylate reductase
MEKKVAVIGCGNIGLSVIEGILKKNVIPLENLFATKRNIEENSPLNAMGVNLSNDNTNAVRNSDLIIIAVKSYNFKGVLDEIRHVLIPGKHIIISITTGIPIEKIKEMTDAKVPVFRAMPNISASIGSSVSCICHKGAGAADVKAVKDLFDLVGKTMIIEEELMESATILGSCGVAYVLRFIRAMIQGGIQIGFDAAVASAIVNQTVKGAAELLIEGGEHPEHEIDKVTTPKGCTIVGLNEMEHNGFSSSLIKGIVASYEKIEK